jgi:lipoprotein-releasing system permease protein
VALNVESIRQGLAWLTGTELFPPELYYLSQLPSEIDPGQTAAVVGMALALSFLATLYPSLRAARLDPVEALRWECDEAPQLSCHPRCCGLQDHLGRLARR